MFWRRTAVFHVPKPMETHRRLYATMEPFVVVEVTSHIRTRDSDLDGMPSPGFKSRYLKRPGTAVEPSLVVTLSSPILFRDVPADAEKAEIELAVVGKNAKFGRRRIGLGVKFQLEVRRQTSYRESREVGFCLDRRRPTESIRLFSGQLAMIRTG